MDSRSLGDAVEATLLATAMVITMAIAILPSASSAATSRDCQRQHPYSFQGMGEIDKVAHCEIPPL